MAVEFFNGAMHEQGAISAQTTQLLFKPEEILLCENEKEKDRFLFCDRWLAGSTGFQFPFKHSNQILPLLQQPTCTSRH